ncbi:hypothetical protein B0F90DRAFT_1819574 [Multifurca ochricompacta]|uniref:GST N-terminal domain-containing protein n=1 Tax=Multifurca ochricompacta TaxID=376703 RepID=A0AAD4QLM4_9AGAM|nr:hypothetical protein B0F90DRAFT_1819574 [Multifurca ochricompacta]
MFPSRDPERESEAVEKQTFWLIYKTYKTALDDIQLTDQQHSYNLLTHSSPRTRKNMSKPVLYTFPHSVWAAAPHLALPRVVNLIEGANFDPEFVKVNPHATLPTLIHEGKSFTSTVAVINYLVSISSRKIAPETSITTVRNDEELAKTSSGFANIFTSTRLDGLKRSISGVHALLNGQAPDEVKQGFFNVSTALWESIKSFIFETLPAAITEGPFIGGSRPGIDDLHVGAWLARIAFLSGGQKCDQGVVALEKRFGPVPEKVKVYWAAWIGRDSWVRAYPDNVLH